MNRTFAEQLKITEMAELNFNDLAQVLDEAKGAGLNFEGKANNWNTEKEAQELIQSIEKCPKLEYLNLEGNTLGVNAAKAIGIALEKHPELKRALWKDLFTGRLKTEIPEALKHLGNGMITAGVQLSVLDCSDNALGPNGMKGLVHLLKSPTCYTLQELKLNNCGLGIGGGTMLAKALEECLTKSTKAGTPLQLKVFIAGRNRLENDGAAALASVFGEIKTLEHVSMPQNGIYHPGITALSEAFKFNKNMKILDLNDNTIGTLGAMSLADALESMQKLEEINFGDCLLKTAGAVYIAEALQDRHLEIETLNFASNEIGPDGGLSIASAMHNKKLLNSLILNGNQFGRDGREQITDILASFNKLETLDDLNEDESASADEEVDEVEDDEDGVDDADDNGDEEYEEEEENEHHHVDSDTEEAGDEVSFLDHFKINKSLNGGPNSPTNNFTNNLNDSSNCYADQVARQNSVETFCNTSKPTQIMFNALEENDKVAAFRNYLQIFKGEEYMINLVFAVLKCSTISNDNDALEVALALYKDCFEYATKTKQLKRASDFFLIQLGLLKSEDKSFKPEYNTDACRTALRQAIKLKIVPDDISNMFKCFLERF